MTVVVVVISVVDELVDVLVMTEVVVVTVVEELVEDSVVTVVDVFVVDKLMDD